MSEENLKHLKQMAGLEGRDRNKAEEDEEDDEMKDTLRGSPVCGRPFPGLLG